MNVPQNAIGAPGAPLSIAGFVALALILLVAGGVGARVLAVPAASDLIPLGSNGPSLPVTTGPALRSEGWVTSADPATRRGWSVVTVTSASREDVTITGISTDGATHGFRAVLTGLAPQDPSALVMSDALLDRLDQPGLSTVVLPGGREAVLVLGFTAGCDASDVAFTPSVTLAVSSASMGSGSYTLDASDNTWVRTVLRDACAPRADATP